MATDMAGPEPMKIGSPRFYAAESLGEIGTTGHPSNFFWQPWAIGEGSMTQLPRGQETLIVRGMPSRSGDL